MVTARLTDVRNSAASLGIGPGPVPVKKYQTRRIPGIKFLIAILNWIWPPGRCNQCNFILLAKSLESLDHAGVDVVDGVEIATKRDSVASQYSSSDDGGFLPRRAPRHPSWRRPIVTSPSQLSFQSHDDSAQSSYQRMLRHLTMRRHGVRPVPPLHTISGSLGSPLSPGLYVNTPSRVSRFHASSPAISAAPWSPAYFSDLSSVHPSSVERSFPTPQRASYFHELPTLHAIHEENAFVPLHRPAGSPNYYQNIGGAPFGPRRYRASYPARRSARAIPEVAFPILNLGYMPQDASPSTSSGFGSKNTSTAQNQSSQSGGTGEWRFLPPYRPPPPPTSRYRTLTSPSSYTMTHWLDLIARLKASSEKGKAVDVGSVDGHYEFDPTSPTPSVSTPTGLEMIDALTMPRKRPPRWDNIDARVQAMKEEFYEWRRRQQTNKATEELESAC